MLYAYRKDRYNPRRYRIYDRTFASQIGWVMRYVDSHFWHAELFTDPLITGTGRTRDQAVDDAVNQVGGLG